MAYLSTSAEFIQRTYRYLREASASPTKWPSAQVVDYIDEAQAALCAELNLLQSRWSVRTSAGVGLYPISGDILGIRYVLHRAEAGDKYFELEQASLPDFFTGGRDFEASGKATHWALVGGDAGLTGINIQLYPTPDTSAVSGVLVIGTETPESIATSATPIPRELRSLVPILAAVMAWEDLGADDEVKRYDAMYQTRVKKWRILNPDRSPDATESRTFGESGIGRPYGIGVGRRTLLSNPLNM